MSGALKLAQAEKPKTERPFGAFFDSGGIDADFDFGRGGRGADLVAGAEV
jgi:hypothetical protein